MARTVATERGEMVAMPCCARNLHRRDGGFQCKLCLWKPDLLTDFGTVGPPRMQKYAQLQTYWRTGHVEGVLRGLVLC